ncbi:MULTISPECIES: heavy-metal-associated domain-containing protein [unclassified Neisseria]|uniref:heavy-metal-associated domain-containing protein n=1 Tax=unclassified Neisseria TaxID=2623750 RepID=UPI00107161B1|nr:MULTISPECIES: heavy-metal-associated domain-containing protein [unclassified Neisseria]MBF0804155.1 heavy-metal-associated domain-containing protein [Neisseria sp. 19428wB4_WF04]TFU43120.1 copper chaperone [Neisseria sp. WF04]
METITLNIGGMTCGGCVKSVTKVLEQLNGVGRVEVSLENAAALIIYDAGKIQTAALIEAVEGAGFDVSL